MSDNREIKKGDRMSRREEEVFRFLGAGLMNKQIAWELGIGEATVKALVSAVLRKTGAVSRSQVVLIVHQLSVDGELEKARAAARIQKTSPSKLLPSALAAAVGRDCHKDSRT